MAIKIEVPELGESVLEATVARWLKKEGDFVNVGDVLVELETDKVNLEVGAKGAGVLQKIEVPEGQDVKVGEVLGSIDEKAAEGKEERGEEERGKAEEHKPEPVAVEAKQAEPQQEERGGESSRSNGQGEMERQAAPQVSPVAARLARDRNVDVNKITGTGTEGRITKADVESYLQRQGQAQGGARVLQAQKEHEVQQPAQPMRAASSDRQEERTRMSRRRRTIAQRLLEASQT